MAQTAAHLLDHVIPRVPVRQWVRVCPVRLPIPLRLLLAAQPKLVTPVLQVVHRVIARHLLDQAGLKAEQADSGGRISFGPDGHLWIATGDNHDPGLPQDPKRLGGKVLRVDRDGKAAPGNNAPAGFDARIFTYGHCNVQGIAFRPVGQPGAGQAFVGEHGPNHSDEVTALVAGGNAGWDPQNRPDLRCSDGYCGYSGTVQTIPMTDLQRFPNAMRPSWNNNERSQGTGAVAFLEGPQWGAWNGRLAVGLMRDQRLDVLTLDARGMASGVETAKLPALRLRSLVPGPDGALRASTDDGQVLRIAPRAR